MQKNWLSLVCSEIFYEGCREIVCEGYIIVLNISCTPALYSYFVLFHVESSLVTLPVILVEPMTMFQKSVEAYVYDSSCLLLFLFLRKSIRWD